MRDAWLSDGRANQKRRTRAALVAAALDLLRQGQLPTVAEVADAALVSRATAYRYFPTQEALLSEAELVMATRAELDRILELARQGDDPLERVDAVVRADRAMTLDHESAFRAMLRSSLAPHPEDPTRVPRRPGNRLRWFAEALAPLRGRLGDCAFQRLVAALSLCVGTEAVVVLRDICGLSVSEAEGVSRWAARALVRAALDEAGQQERRPSSAAPIPEQSDAEGIVET